MKNIFYFILIILIFFLTSCAGDMFEKMATNNIPPVITKPIVKSFEIENYIIAQWPEDVGADEYVLYRSELPDGGYTVIYQGTELQYEDYVEGYDPGKFFYYKLAKRRESKYFDKSDYSCGVVADMVDDKYECNKFETCATNLDGKIILTSNIYYYRDDYDNELFDTDWYEIHVKKGFYARFVFDYETKSTNTSNTSMINNLHLYSLFNDAGQIDLSDEEGFVVENEDTGNGVSTELLTFKIGVNKANILANPDLAGYGKIIYSLKFDKIDVIDTP